MKSKFIFGAGLVSALLVGSTVANATEVFSQGFETDTAGWYTPAGYGSITQAASGSGGITAYGGSYFAFVNDPSPSGATAGDSTGPYTKFDGYRSTFPGTFTASVAIYLDPSWGAGTGFDWDVESRAAGGGYGRDYIFHVGNVGGNLLLGASNNSSNANVDLSLTNPPDYNVTAAGWYIFQQKFYDNGGVLAVDMNLLDSSMALLYSTTLSNPSDLIPSSVGGNGYGWFNLINVPGSGLAIDDAKLDVTPIPATLPLFASGLGALGLLGWRRKRKKVAALAAA